MTKDPTPFLHWLARTQPIRIVFIHIVVGLLAWSLINDRPESPWDIVGWCITFIPFAGYWAGNYWYWVVRLKRGTVQ